LFFRPAILINDPVLIKNVLTTNFSHFYSRGVYIEPKNDPMSVNLFSLEGDDWKSLRTRLAGAFTSGKLKGMFDNIIEIGDHLIKYLQPFAVENKAIEIREMSSRYVADCLASIAFGQEGISCIENPNHEFKLNAKKLNQGKNYLNILRRASVFICPR
jgi:cytochrome P450 family 6